ncbi:UDP-glucose 4-epimerase GalE [Porticoccaceae bacterium]|jgi:UDP-glucose 4-epimerase|nr:UDP-glucose 4-epimerase GalE [Porticoccaceae bacterium]MDB2566056.1 UDP-glucose 4-epimerase GalE [Porticoccaceae bacterium]
MTVLVTGGAGYIGSHTLVCLLNLGYEVVVYDNLVNSSIKALRRVEEIAGKDLEFVEGDVTDSRGLDDLFAKYSIDAVIHFAALKAVGESSQRPLQYYETNVYGSLCLLKAMEKARVNHFVYSSSATVYGEMNPSPYVETMELGSPSSPYGASKVMVERVLTDTARVNPKFRAISLRYFNPVGAHPSGLIGEDPSGIPNNLLPFITQVAVGLRDSLSVFGGDYPTADGTCIRDYLHVMDLAEGHVAAIDWLAEQSNFNGVEAFNLGAGTGVSVLEIIASFEAATCQKINFKIVERRAGDLPAFWANADKADKVLNWQAKRTLVEMMEDAWRWQSKNPNGFS